MKWRSAIGQIPRQEGLPESGSIAANDGLRSPQAMEQLRQKLRNGASLLNDTERALEATSQEVLGERLLQTHRQASTNPGFAKAKRELQGVGPDLHQRVRGRDNGKGGPSREDDLPPVSGGSPWAVGIVVTCSLAWWICPAADVIVFGIVIGYLIWTWVN